MRRPSRLLVPALAAALLLPAAVPASAQGDTAVVAINTKDGFDIFRFAFAIRRAAADVVDTDNAAVAFASCTDCQTVAIAIQVVLVYGDPDVVTPDNLAIAINQNCVACDTLATAYQFVMSAETGLHFTAEGNRRLAEIRRALLELRGAGLTAVEIAARVDALMDELREVLATQLVAPDPGPPDPAPSPTGSGSPPPPVSPSGSPTPEPVPSGSASASPSASPEPTPTGTP